MVAIAGRSRFLEQNKLESYVIEKFTCIYICTNCPLVFFDGATAVIDLGWLAGCGIIYPVTERCP